MEYGARMIKELRMLMLSNSKWENKIFQLVNERDKLERKKYLFDFQEKIKNYREGVVSEVTFIKKTDLMDKKLKTRDGSLIDRPSINYFICKE